MISVSAEQDVIALSQQKWRWMSDRNVDALAALFDGQRLLIIRTALIAPGAIASARASGAALC